MPEPRPRGAAHRPAGLGPGALSSSVFHAILPVGPQMLLPMHRCLQGIACIPCACVPPAHACPLPARCLPVACPLPALHDHSLLLPSVLNRRDLLWLRCKCCWTRAEACQQRQMAGWTTTAEECVGLPRTFLQQRQRQGAGGGGLPVVGTLHATAGVCIERIKCVRDVACVRNLSCDMLNMCGA